jgi:hypothetical protein
MDIAHCPLDLFIQQHHMDVIFAVAVASTKAFPFHASFAANAPCNNSTDNHCKFPASANEMCRRPDFFRAAFFSGFQPGDLAQQGEFGLHAIAQAIRKER